MTNLRFTHKTKSFASSRKSAEIIKRVRKLKQKIDKNKKSLYVDSRSIRSHSENILSNVEKFVADSIFENDFVIVFNLFVVFDFFVFAFSTFDFFVFAFFVFDFSDVDLIFDDMNHEIFLRMTKTLIDIDITFVESFRFVLDSTIDVFVDIFLFVFFFELIIVVLVSRIILDLITKYVIIDSKNFVDELNHLQQKIIKRRDFKQQMKTHDKQRVFENSFIVIEFSLGWP